MEFWVVVAAAGAGYAAQYLQSSSEDKDNLLELKKCSNISTHEQSYSTNMFHQVREIFCPFRRLARKRAKKEDSDEGVLGFRQLNLDSSEKMSSTDCTDDEKSKHRFCGLFNSTGLPNGMALLYLGITTGMLSAIIANKREIEKLNEKLNWTKNLVEELQEELEMKEMFTVEELAHDSYENPNLYIPSISAVEPMSPSSEMKVDEPRQTSENTNLAAENHESMSEIERELEAELERLEMNMKFSSFERISDSVELDPEDEVDVAQGDLKLDCLNVQFPGSSDCDSSGTGIAQSKLINYPVSPRELSLRLHEVLESRLEAQIKDLETALYNSQSRACSLEAQHMFSHKDFASSESVSSASPESPYCYHEDDEETIRRYKTMYGSETILDIDKRVPPFDGALIDRPNMEENDLIDIMLF